MNSASRPRYRKSFFYGLALSAYAFSRTAAKKWPLRGSKSLTAPLRVALRRTKVHRTRGLYMLILLEVEGLRTYRQKVVDVAALSA